MTLKPFTSEDLFGWIISKENFLLLDVRNENDFARFNPRPLYELGRS